MSQRYYYHNKYKYLPTRSVSRGQFRGYNDIRRFQCFKYGCKLNTNEFALCEYCRHVPYVSSPLRFGENINQDYIISGSNSSTTPTTTSRRGSFIAKKRMPTVVKAIEEEEEGDEEDSNNDLKSWI
ncbi:hypothetical protein JA1_004055 [Spathaspora sp. JA1]|nr:hypothetical protein JA1_004055 [Spathaspora sp. JA1]